MGLWGGSFNVYLFGMGKKLKHIFSLILAFIQLILFQIFDKSKGSPRPELLFSQYVLGKYILRYFFLRMMNYNLLFV